MAPLPKKDPTHSHTVLPAVSGVSQITSSLEPPWSSAVRSPQIEGTAQPFSVREPLPCPAVALAFEFGSSCQTELCVCWFSGPSLPPGGSGSA